MIANPLEEAIRRVLNDRRIFWMAQELIGSDDWQKLYGAFSKADMSTAEALIARAKNSLEAKIKAETDRRKKRNLEEDKALLEGLDEHIREGSPSAKRLFELLESFGPLHSNLPSTEKFGGVIEGHGRATVEQFFLSKIQRAKDRRQRQALEALLEVVKWLYERRVEPLEIAYFVRKIDSLPEIVEVIR